MNQKTFNYLSWGLVATTLALVFYVWGSSISWKIGNATIYQWFPFFGLVAWTTMAGHYYLGALRLTFKNLKAPRFYRRGTGYLVLGSLIAHPALLAHAQSRNGLGQPPDSYYAYVGEGLKLAIMIGVISYAIFLSFEVFERLKKRKFIQKYWSVVSISQSLAMTLIWVHAIRLGSHLGGGWFQAVWIVFGLALIPCFYIIHKADFTK